MTPFFNNVFPPEVITFVSCRPDDFSLAADQNGLTEQQKQILFGQLGYAFAQAINIRQVHGDRIIFMPQNSPYGSPQVLEEADGIVTDAVNVPIVIRTADCVPIFLYDQYQKQIGLLHAGWKGTQKQILLKGLELIGARAKDITIAFGPAIRECCYEVRADVLEHFPDEGVQRNGKYYLDLIKVNKRQALDYGIPKKNIADCEICTCCDKSYFSYRREGESAGRNISLMMLRK